MFLTCQCWRAGLPNIPRRDDAPHRGRILREMGTRAAAGVATFSLFRRFAPLIASRGCPVQDWLVAQLPRRGSHKPIRDFELAPRLDSATCRASTVGRTFSAAR